MLALSANFLAFYLGAIFIERSGIFSGVTVFLLTAFAGTIAASKLEKWLSSLMSRAFSRTGDNNVLHPADETLYGRSGFGLTSGRFYLSHAFTRNPVGHRTAQPLLVILFFLSCGIGYLIAGPPAVAAETLDQAHFINGKKVEAINFFILSRKKSRSVSYLYVPTGNNKADMKSKSTKDYKLPMSFIVRVYRFTGEGPEGIVGVVETVGEAGESGFTGIEELWEILASAGRRGKGTKPKGGSHVKQV